MGLLFHIAGLEQMLDSWQGSPGLKWCFWCMWSQFSEVVDMTDRSIWCMLLSVRYWRVHFFITKAFWTDRHSSTPQQREKPITYCLFPFVRMRFREPWEISSTVAKKINNIIFNLFCCSVVWEIKDYIIYFWVFPGQNIASFVVGLIGLRGLRFNIPFKVCHV